MIEILWFYSLCAAATSGWLFRDGWEFPDSVVLVFLMSVLGGFVWPGLWALGFVTILDDWRAKRSRESE